MRILQYVYKQTNIEFTYLFTKYNVKLSIMSVTMMY